VGNRVLFSVLNYAAIDTVKKQSISAPTGMRIAMMGSPYIVSETWLLYGVGTGLCIGSSIYLG
jgi:hypothetical protein